MNVEPDFKDIEVVVNGQTYSRTLKSIEDYEYMELGEAVVMENVQALGIPEDLVSMREMYDANMFKPINASNIGSLEGQLSGGGSGARLPILISDDAAHSAEVKKVVAGEINSTIPLVVRNISSGSAGSTEELTLYVPVGAEVSVNGETAQHVKTTDTYSEYHYTLDCKGIVNCFYTVTVVHNGQTETVTKLVKNKVTAAYSLIDLSDSGLLANLQAANNNPSSDATVNNVTGDGVEVTFPVVGNASAMLSVDTNSIAGNLTDFTPYNAICVEITNTGDTATEGVELMLNNGRDRALSETICGRINPGQTKIVYFEIPEMRETLQRVIREVIIRPVDPSTEQTYTIKSMSAVYTTEFEEH